MSGAARLPRTLTDPELTAEIARIHQEASNVRLTARQRTRLEALGEEQRRRIIARNTRKVMMAIKAAPRGRAETVTGLETSP
jgi:hypothetical protein